MGIWVKSGSDFLSITNRYARKLVQFTAQRHCLKNRSLLTFIPVVLILSLSSSPVWSFQTYDLRDATISQGSSGLDVFPSPASADGADACSPLLQAIRYGSKTPQAGSRYSASHKLDRRNIGNRSAPGMMVGVLLGVKFALGPKERSSKARKRAVKLDLWSMGDDVRGNRNVLAVSAYRTCKKEQALKALNNFRWQR